MVTAAIPTLNILLVEDEPIAIKIHSTLLQSLGYLFDVAETGQQALEKTAKIKYDAILMDIGLPDIDGIEVTAQIRQSNNINHQTPIIVLTGYCTNEVESRCSAAGTNAVVSKPIERAYLESILNQCW